MTARKLLLTVHLWLGLVAAFFLVILGLTGSIIAFENDIDHWLHPGLWYVALRGQPIPEGVLIAKVEQQFAPARVTSVQSPRERNLAHLMQLTDRTTVLLNPYDGSVLGK